jgi:hypothetical protein
MTLHFSHIGLTEGRTFTFALSCGVYRYPSGAALATVSAAATAPWYGTQRTTLPYGRTPPILAGLP